MAAAVRQEYCLVASILNHGVEKPKMSCTLVPEQKRCGSRSREIA
jgi:hypothetical protein